MTEKVHGYQVIMAVAHVKLVRSSGRTQPPLVCGYLTLALLTVTVALRITRIGLRAGSCGS